LLGWAAEKFGEQLCLTCSWQKQSSALVHMLSQLGLRVDVIELDTEQLTPEQAADVVIAKLEQLGLVGSEVSA
jgi:3'-phosphoadenosine 5'-phosphosulfate sulfotransferase (PAPS reductase)/FAD synthetase